MNLKLWLPVKNLVFLKYLSNFFFIKKRVRTKSTDPRERGDNGELKKKVSNYNTHKSDVLQPVESDIKPRV
jgi:hypothetical protein